MNLDYIAGFFDGEGNVSISNNGVVSIGIVNTNKHVLDNIQNLFGGTVTSRSQMVNKKQYVWRIYGDSAVAFAREMQGRCYEKHVQLNLAISWSEERGSYQGVRIKGRKGNFSDPQRLLKIKEYQTKITQSNNESK